MTRILTIATMIAAFGFGALYNSASSQQSGTSAEREACTPDVYKFCDAAIPDEKRILACLKKNIKLLSPSCQKVISDDK